MLSKIRSCNRVVRISAVNNGFLNIEIVEPTGNIIKASIGIAVFVEQTIVLDGKANVVDAISYSID